MNLTKHSTHQLIIAMAEAQALIIRRKGDTHVEGGLLSIQREMAVRMADGKLNQSLPDRLEDYDS